MSQAAPTTVGAEKPPKTILYIEDDRTNATLMGEIIALKLGWRMIHAEDAETGLALAHADPPDVIVMDVNLPGMDGFQALRELRSSSLAHIPVVGVSGDLEPDELTSPGAVGFTAYLTKPFRVEKILRILTETLASPK